MTTFIGLLRGINVGGRNRIPMSELREVCGSVGGADVRTYIQSGNLIFSADALPANHEEALEQAIDDRFALKIPVLVRSAAQWSRYVEENPFPEASETEPNLVMLALSKSPLQGGAVEALTQRGDRNERVVRVGDAFWIHFAGGSGRSKITPTLLDRFAGSPVTTRNWRTVLKLHEMVAATDP